MYTSNANHDRHTSSSSHHRHCRLARCCLHILYTEPYTTHLCSDIPHPTGVRHHDSRTLLVLTCWYLTRAPNIIQLHAVSTEAQANAYRQRKMVKWLSFRDQWSGMECNLFSLFIFLGFFFFFLLLHSLVLSLILRSLMHSRHPLLDMFAHGLRVH